MKSKTKPKHDGWCAFDPKGKVMEWDRFKWRAARQIAYKSAKRGELSIGDIWKRLRKEGYTVKRVKIVPLGK